MKLSVKAKHAIMLGSLCSISYFAVYIARNLLGAVTPGMTQILLRAGSSHLPRHIVCHAVSPGDTENTWRQISVGV